MDLDQEFVKLYEGWKKGKYKITDDKGNIIGTYNSGSKAQKVVDDLMQQGKYDKLTVEIIEAHVKHECPKCKGEGCEHCDGKGYHIEDEDDDPVGKKEASTYRDKQKKSKDKKQFGISRKKGNIRHGGSGYGEDVDENYDKNQLLRVQHDERLIAEAGDICSLDKSDLRSKAMQKVYDKKCSPEMIKKKKSIFGKIAKGLDLYNGDKMQEGYKDLPPHLQKLIKKIEKKQKDWNKQNPDAKIQTLVYNPETGKPDIIVKETMKLEDTVKSVMEGKLPPALQKAIDKKKGKKDDEKDDSEVKEDSDKDTPGTQGDMDEYQAKRKKIAKKFGVSSCSQLSGAKKKACYSALDKAHVADHEEQVELEKMKTEETKDQKSFSKLFSHLKGMMKEKKKKMLKGYASKY